MPSQKSEITDDVILQHMERIIDSREFIGSPRQQRLLRHLTENTLRGDSKYLKGYTIGVEVFDRTAAFDPSVDSIVRVETSRLRSKLLAYYLRDGREDQIQFELPKGSYSVEFRARDSETPIEIRPAESPSQPPSPQAFPTRNKPSLAVMPFASHSPDPTHTSFANGFTDNLIFALSDIDGLFLASRQSSLAHSNKELRADEIGVALGVRYLLEGSVQRIENQVRISVQLSDTMTGGIIWTERYDREVENIFLLQDQISRDIVKMLHIKLTPLEERNLAYQGTHNLEAFGLFMKGMENHWKYTRHSIDLAIQYFNKAIDLDENYAAAHAWLSRSITFQWIMCWDGPNALELAYWHARTAVKLNKYLPCAHSALGWVELWRKNGAEAIASCSHAVLLDPSNSEALKFLSLCQASIGEGEKALQSIEMSLRLSPSQSPFQNLVKGMAHYVMGDNDQAISALEQSAKMNEFFFPVHYHLCWLYKLQGRELAWRKKKEQLSLLTKSRHITVRGPWIDPTLSARYEMLIDQAELAMTTAHSSNSA